jgi:hypothetical protein
MVAHLSLRPPPPPPGSERWERLGSRLVDASERRCGEQPPPIRSGRPCLLFYASRRRAPEAAPDHGDSRGAYRHRSKKGPGRAGSPRACLARQSENPEALVEVGESRCPAETDREKLLSTILSRARALDRAPEGRPVSISRRARRANGELLRFALAQNDASAAPFAFRTASLPLDDSSIAGSGACSGLALNLPDVRSLPPGGAPYRFDAGFDERHRVPARAPSWPYPLAHARRPRRPGSCS